MSLNFAKLKIFGGSFSTIEDYSFHNDSFANLKELELINLGQLTHLTKYVFFGLAAIETLAMRNLNLRQIDAGIMEPFQYKLTSLQFSEMRNTIDPRNVTGDIFISPTIVDLGFNTFPDLLCYESFKGLKSVQSLFLRSSNIEFLPADTFQAIYRSIKLIHLNGNRLMNVPVGLFNNIIQIEGIKVHLEDNPWLCDCSSMIEFRELVIQYPEKMLGNPTCFAPYAVQGIRIVDAEIDCTVELTSSTSTQSSTSFSPDYENSTETTDAPPLDKSVQLTCVDYQKGPKYEVNPEEPYVVKSRSTEFIIYEDANAKVYVEFNRTCSDTALIWFHNSSLFDNERNLSSLDDYYDCVENYDEQIEITNIDYNINYIFCIISHKAKTVSPFDCAPYLRILMPRPPFDDNPAFLNEDQKMMAIIVFVVSIVSALIFGGFLALCLLRISKPKPGPFIKRNDIPDYSGYHVPAIYMTPTPPRCPSLTDRPSYVRRLSDTSIDSTRSYILANTPTPLELLSWRMDKQRRQSSKIMDPVYLERLPNDPPPLPPHPNRRSKDSTASSSSNQSTTSTEPLCSISLKLDRESCYNNNSYA